MAITVIGALLRDVEIEGRVHRLSPAEPCPVLEDGSWNTEVGGAGRSALALAHLGEDVCLYCSADPSKDADLLTILFECNVDVRLVATTPVQTRTRFRTDHKTLLRLDSSDRLDDDSNPWHVPVDRLCQSDAVLVSDYPGMTLSEELLTTLAELAQTTPVIWDLHPRGTEPVAGAIVQASEDSLISVLGNLSTSDGSLDVAQRELQKRAWAALILTRGSNGSVLLERNSKSIVAARQGSLPCATDTIGAGDSFAAGLAAGLERGLSIAEAMKKAQRLSAIYVAALNSLPVEVVDPTPVEVRAGYACAGVTIAATGGCFDLLHPGHADLLNYASSMEDALIVLLNDDLSIARLKGPSRPYMNVEERTTMLRSMRGVDAVIVFTEDTPISALSELRPQTWVKGSDYQSLTLPEAGTLNRQGCRVLFAPQARAISTTSLVNRIRDQHD